MGQRLCSMGALVVRAIGRAHRTSVNWALGGEQNSKLRTRVLIYLIEGYECLNQVFGPANGPFLYRNVS
jgi:hypothetical protein